MYLATITLAISFVAQFMINVKADSLDALKSILKKKFQKRNKRPECPLYTPCQNFVDAMQHHHKHVTLGKFPNNIMLFGKNVCAAGSTSANIQCGMTYTESVTLTGDLLCNGFATPTFITMDGADAILDCNGYKIFGSTDTPRGVAVSLTGGASVINCPIGNVERGIEISGDGSACSTVMNVDVAFISDDAIAVRNSGTTVLDSIVIDSSDNDGIEVGGSPTGLVIMSDITISGVGRDGICLLTNVPRVELYGDIFIEKAGSDGIAFDGSNNQVTAYCSLTLFDNEDGISFDGRSGRFIFESESITTSCFNTGRDIDGTGPGFFDRVSGANVQCDKVAPSGSFNCDEGCVISSLSTVGETPGCLANEDP